MSSSLTLYNSASQPVEITGDSLGQGAIGSVEFFAGTTAPVGYLVCPPESAVDSAYPLKSAYPDLYAYIGDVWGTLTDTTRFKLPNSSKDGKGYFLRGVGGELVGARQDDEEVGLGQPATLHFVAQTGTSPSTNNALGDNIANASNTETRPMAQTMLMCIKAYNSVASTAQVDVQSVIAESQKQIGVGQSWVDVTASRALDVTYTNDTGKPICTSFYCTGNVAMHINGVAAGVQNNTGAGGPLFAIIPTGNTYEAVGGTVHKWSELR